MSCDCGGYCDFHKMPVDGATTCPNTDCRLECDCATITCQGVIRVQRTQDARASVEGNTPTARVG